MHESLKSLRIFAASPSDVASERTKLDNVINSLQPMADYLGLKLDVVDWRVVVPDAGRPQQVIFDQLQPTSWDIFVGILWHRFGTPPGAKDKTGKGFLSGTEEEFKTAYELWKQFGKPRMVLYRCTRALPFDVDPDQLKNVRTFFKLIEDVKGDYPTLYQTFDTTESFEKLALNNLQKLLVEYGEKSKTPISPEVELILAPKIPNNLPRRQAFFGRTKEMEMVMRTLSPADRTWGVLIDGIGGIGKSAIALEAAYRCKQLEVFDAFIFVSAKRYLLEPSGIKEETPIATTLDEFVDETARVLGRHDVLKMTGEGKRRAILNVLRETRTLLIYDNLETLPKEEQEALATWLRFLPQGCKAIITSRRRGGEGGVWLRVEKLDWDAARGIIENEMVRDAVLANKLNRVGKIRWQELFDEANGSPLALVHTLGLMRVRATLTFDGALEMLRGNRDEDLQKFIFQEAREELTENDKTALSALSLFMPSATFEAWAYVANLSRNAMETTIDRLSALSLVDMLGGEERYTLHPLTRVYVRSEFLNEACKTQDFKVQFLEYWLEFARRYRSASEEKKKADWYKLIDTEWTNLHSAANFFWEKALVKVDSLADISALLMASEIAAVLSDSLLSRNHQSKLSAELKQDARFISFNWKNLDVMIKKLLDQQALDPTWGGAISSATHACEALGVIGKKIEAQGSIKFIRDLYQIDNGKLAINISKTSTTADFQMIRQRMEHQDSAESFVNTYCLETSDNLNLDLFHENWASGFVLCAENAVHILDSESLNKLVDAVEARIDDEEYYYPSRVPWCTARILIGLGRCGRNVQNSVAVRRAANWLLRSRGEGGARESAFWNPGTGSWNSSIETTGLCVIALREVGVAPDHPVLLGAMEWLLDQKKYWTEIGHELDGAIAIDAYSRMNKPWIEIVDQINWLSSWAVGQAIWMYATEPSTKTFEQSDRVAFVTVSLINALLWMLRSNLPRLLDALESPNIPRTHLATESNPA